MSDDHQAPAPWHITHLPAPPAAQYHPDPATDRQMQYLADRMAAVEACLGEGTRRMDSMQKELSDNTAITTEVREILGTAKGAFRFFSAVGTVIKWLGGIATAVGTIYALIYMATHGGRMPGE